MKFQVAIKVGLYFPWETGVQSGIDVVENGIPPSWTLLIVLNLSPIFAKRAYKRSRLMTTMTVPLKFTSRYNLKMMLGHSGCNI